MAKRKETIETADDAIVALRKRFTSFHRHSTYQVFSDFLALSACALSNAVDGVHFDERERLYMDTIKRYSKDEVAVFPELLALVVHAFEQAPGEVIYRDVLGELFMTLELGSQWAGQYFTPYSVALMMAMMTVGDADTLRATIEQRGFVRVQEPAVGGGAMVIALADALSRVGVNYQQHLHATCIDTDIKAVHMAYIQLSLLHVPAVVVHGNSLSGECWGTWRTPAHVLGFWDGKLCRTNTATAKDAVQEEAVTTSEPDKAAAETNEPLAQLVLF
jgi:type I restriction-modification system DNA methylase subunit